MNGMRHPNRCQHRVDFRDWQIVDNGGRGVVRIQYFPNVHIDCMIKLWKIIKFRIAEELDSERALNMWDIL